MDTGETHQEEELKPIYEKRPQTDNNGVTLQKPNSKRLE